MSTIAIAGASGFIGRALAAHLRIAGHRVRPLLRPSSPPHPDGIHWNPAGGVVQSEELDGVDAVVNLAGRSIGAARWTAKQKEAMRRSRIQSTRVLSTAIAGLTTPPRMFISASASGYYGDRGEDLITESSSAGAGFLSGLCVEWESAATSSGVRTVLLRSAIVLHPSGGLLQKMLLPWKLGLGARLGDGTHWMPWITLEDEVRAIAWLLEQDDASGPFNLCAPTPVRNHEFTQTLARAVNRPAFLAAPAPILRAVLGEDAARDALLISQRMVPSRLADGGFDFAWPDLRSALNDLLSPR